MNSAELKEYDRMCHVLAAIDKTLEAFPPEDAGAIIYALLQAAGERIPRHAPRENDWKQIKRLTDIISGIRISRNERDDT